MLHATLATGLLASGFFAAVAAAATPADESIRHSIEMGASQPGNYLAAIVAADDRDTASAEVYYREALRADPRNPDLLERAFAAALANGHEPSADSLAQRPPAPDPNNTMARLAIACHAIWQWQYATP